ncbi:hypothetical protein [Bacteroides pyogenes]|uniref:hypothetical protein n=1 Tax=Bacteroides pyogenes TaxID=310300 RepID=UPI001BA4B63E|nr:hypothetical protein [Bacteroides pyogenes]
MKIIQIMRSADRFHAEKLLKARMKIIQIMRNADRFHVEKLLKARMKTKGSRQSRASLQKAETASYFIFRITNL